MSKPLTLNSRVDYIRYTRNNMRDVNLKRTNAPVENNWWFSSPKFALTNGKMAHPSKQYRPAVLNPNLKKVSLPFDAESKYRTSMNAWRLGMGGEEEGSFDYRRTISSRPEVRKQIEDIETSVPQYVPNRQQIIVDMVDKLLREIEKNEIRTKTIDTSIMAGLRDTNARMKLFMDAYNERMRYEVGKGDKTKFGKDEEKKDMAGEEEEEDEDEEEEEDEDEDEDEDEEEPAEEPSNIAILKNIDVVNIDSINPMINEIITRKIQDAFSNSEYLRSLPRENPRNFISSIRSGMSNIYPKIANLIKSKKGGNIYSFLARQIRPLGGEAFDYLSNPDIARGLPTDVILEIISRISGINKKSLSQISVNMSTQSSLLGAVRNANLGTGTTTKRAILPIHNALSFNLVIDLYIDGLSPLRQGLNYDDETGYLTTFNALTAGAGKGATPV